jgi:hypothetical protein
MRATPTGDPMILPRLSLGAAAALLLGAAAPHFSATPPTPLAAPRATAQEDDAALVRRAVLDYVDGFYEGDTAKLVRSVRPEVYKYGFWRPADSTRYVGETMPYTELLAYARRVKARNRPAPPSARKEVVVYEVQDRTASAKLTASWGTDYLLLGKFDGRWMVSSVMWQSPPPRP